MTWFSGASILFDLLMHQQGLGDIPDINGFDGTPTDSFDSDNMVSDYSVYVAHYNFMVKTLLTNFFLISLKFGIGSIYFFIWLLSSISLNEMLYDSL